MIPSECRTHKQSTPLFLGGSERCSGIRVTTSSDCKCGTRHARPPYCNNCCSNCCVRFYLSCLRVNDVNFRLQMVSLSLSVRLVWRSYGEWGLKAFLFVLWNLPRRDVTPSAALKDNVTKTDKNPLSSVWSCSGAHGRARCFCCHFAAEDRHKWNALSRPWDLDIPLLLLCCVVCWWRLCQSLGSGGLTTWLVW